jgi:hypothetical protein
MLSPAPKVAKAKPLRDQRVGDDLAGAELPAGKSRRAIHDGGIDGGQGNTLAADSMRAFASRPSDAYTSCKSDAPLVC